MLSLVYFININFKSHVLNVTITYTLKVMAIFKNISKMINFDENMEKRIWKYENLFFYFLRELHQLRFYFVLIFCCCCKCMFHCLFNKKANQTRHKNPFIFLFLFKLRKTKVITKESCVRYGRVCYAAVLVSFTAAIHTSVCKRDSVTAGQKCCML